MNLIGYHFVGNVFSQAEVAEHFDLLRATKPAWVNIQGAEQYKEALEFAKTTRRELPEIWVMFRHCIQSSTPGGPAVDSQDDDTGRHARMSATDWWEKIGKLYVGSDLTIVTDNESMAADLTYYALWQADVMKMAAQWGVSLAVGRFSTHNPPTAQWKQLDPMWRALDIYHNLHVWSPNVYFSDDNFDGVEHIFEGWRRCADLNLKSPRTVIGEFAYAKNLDPHAGYLAVNMDGGEYVQRLETRGAPLWAAEIPACVFAVGNWPKERNTFGLNQAALKALRERKPSPVTSPPYPAYPLLPAVTDSRWKQTTIKTDPVGVLVRSEPLVRTNNVVYSGLKGTHSVFFIDDPATIYADWRMIKAGGVVGWVNTVFFDVVTATPVPVPPPTPVDYVTRAEAQKMVEAAVAAALEKFRMDFIGKLVLAISQDIGEKV